MTPSRPDDHYTVQVLASLRSNEFPRVSFIEDDGLSFEVGGFEFAGIPSTLPGQDLPVTSSSAPKITDLAASSMPSPPYSWTQTSQDLTVTVPLPEGTNKRNIRCALTPTSLRLTTQNPDALLLEGTLYDKIRFDESVWSLEKEKGVSVVSLHLEKHNTLRWIHVFQQDDGVLEVHDPGQMAVIQERMEKYTSEEVLAGKGKFFLLSFSFSFSSSCC